jgi:16S rRNA (adenine1518-N6/adenine1519-N6)-dimethyltransferase
MALKNNKSLGQHWLKNRIILDDIADLAVKDGVANCLEIGPGLGTLTSSLLRRFEKVTSVEFDENLAKNLPKSFPGKNLEVINADILKFDFNSVEAPYSVAGNIPYYITSPIIERLLLAENKPERIVLLIQKEVAERIAAEDGKQSVLSLFVQNRADVELGPVVLKGEFTPPPKVDSEIIILNPKTPEIKEEVFKLIKIGFSSPRKKLIANLAGLKSKEELKQIFEKLNLDENARPANLGLKDWERLQESML